MDTINRRIINNLQGGFPVTESPYRDIAFKIGITEDELLWRLEVMKTDQIYSRFGPLYNAEALGGAVTLAAIKVPEDDFERVTELVNAHDEVAHNYRRSPSPLNMWFVLSTESSEEISVVLDEIAQETGLEVYNMPKQKEYFLELKLFV
ncbi:MAG: Lrp/AsnC family transcriptional regulator [Gammaproteobacteria bacterium]|uniref:siroheme decarboxylase n=1 Tax=Candidatus Thiopontia autotrophica TaxID=2841688 RepID=A0A8J6PDF2_9GAMM|nr:Lrp/AsnC family transcriptional regulator [Candidatus Thiopontia autotrophica]MBL6969160.1 Lrp/AsnC family transcriptional regulator [Gammaproteobacteria bacterium]